MNINSLPFDAWLEMNEKGMPTGALSAQASLFMEQLVNQLQTNLSNNGYNIPQQPTTYINNNLAANNSTGLMVYDNTAHALKININGAIKTVQVA